MNTYLIKRKAFGSGTEIEWKAKDEHWFSEAVITRDERQPPSVKLQIDDKVYVSESGGPVYACGPVVDKWPESKCFDSLESVVRYTCELKGKGRDEGYWAELCRRFAAKSQSAADYKLRLHKYAVRLSLLSPPIYPAGEFKVKHFRRGRQVALSPLNDEDLNALNSPSSQDFALEPKIPGHLRLFVYSLFSAKGIGVVVDIDHFVPKSVGGPGSIPENLVPLGLSLNRYKGPAVPRALYSIAAERGYVDIPRHFLDAHDDFLREKKVLGQSKAYPGCTKKAKAITEWVKAQCAGSPEFAREFYLSVLEKHHPDYASVLRSVADQPRRG